MFFGARGRRPWTQTCTLPQTQEVPSVIPGPWQPLRRELFVGQTTPNSDKSRSRPSPLYRPSPSCLHLPSTVMRGRISSCQPRAHAASCVGTRSLHTLPESVYNPEHGSGSREVLGFAKPARNPKLAASRRSGEHTVAVVTCSSQGQGGRCRRRFLEKKKVSFEPTSPV